MPACSLHCLPHEAVYYSWVGLRISHVRAPLKTLFERGDIDGPAPPCMAAHKHKTFWHAEGGRQRRGILLLG